ncbi:MAG: hypothetical protein Fur005_11650 [Roseiflexaceae bacterium]
MAYLHSSPVLDPARLERLGHSLKGSTASLGATVLSRLWHVIEQYGMHGQTSIPPTLIKRIEAEITSSTAAFYAQIAASPDPIATLRRE